MLLNQSLNFRAWRKWQVSLPNASRHSANPEFSTDRIVLLQLVSLSQKNPLVQLPEILQPVNKHRTARYINCNILIRVKKSVEVFRSSFVTVPLGGLMHVQKGFIRLLDPVHELVKHQRATRLRA